MKILFLIVLLIIFSYLIIGIFYIKQNVFVDSINSAPNGNICLTFDDGPDPIMTPKILDVLKKHNIKASFFLIGKNASTNQELVKRIFQEGHTIGNHTYYHKATFPISSKKKITEEIRNSNELIEKIISKKVKFFRPPFGITNLNINIVLKKLNLTSIGWDIRSLDTITNDSAKLYKRIQKKIERGGSIILFHDRCKSSLEILEKIIIYCLKKKYKFISIDNA